MRATYQKVGDWRYCRSAEYNWNFNLKTGFFARWGRTFEEDPNTAPCCEILDIEVSTICNNGCDACYKSNTGSGRNMSLETFSRILKSMPMNLTQIALGIGDIDANPDLYAMMAFAREIGVVPNITINGRNISEQHYNQLSRLCGAVAVSHYNDGCFDAVQELTTRGLDQVNIHQILSKETTQECFDLINRAANDPRLAKLNAIVFLLLKPKGKRNALTPVTDNTVYRDLLLLANEKGIGIGMDSCGAPSLMKSCENIPKIRDVIRVCAEPCESTCFSIYVSVDGEVYPCSFCEGTPGWETGIAIKESMVDVWNNDRIVAWRNNLINSTKDCICDFKQGCRSCPVFDITPCRSH